MSTVQMILYVNRMVFNSFQGLSFVRPPVLFSVDTNMKKRLTIFFGLFLFTLALGCGKNCSVTGKVTFSDGTPLDRGTVLFENDSMAARGTIKKDGTFTMISGDNKGVPKGTYKVSIGRLTEPTITTTPSPDGKGPSKVTITANTSPIDTKYSSSAKSGLTCEVKGRTKYDITVEPPQ